MRAFLAVVVLVLAGTCLGQVGGGSAGYSQGRPNPESARARERAKRAVSKDDLPATGAYVDAAVLMNVKADEYVAVFAITQEGPSLDDARGKNDAAISAFLEALRSLGVRSEDRHVDFIAQNRIYGYEVAGDVAREKVTGFEVKKNVSIRYRDPSALERFLAAASRSGIFDLVKVDYVVKDIDAVQTRLMEEAVRVVRRKAGNQARLLGSSFGPTPQIVAERYSAYYPTDMYSSYVAQEAESVSYRQNLAVQGARKTRTFFFDPLSGDGFDRVIQPVITEPVVQFTLYLKVRYEARKATAKK